MLLSNLLKLHSQPVFESFEKTSPMKRYQAQWARDRLYEERHETWRHTQASANATALAYEWMDQVRWSHDDSIEKRQKALGYTTDKPQKFRSIVEALHLAMPETVGMSFDSIAADDFKTVDVAEAKSRKHSKDIMFWEYENGDLAAVSSGTKIVLAIYQNGYEYTPSENYEEGELAKIEAGDVGLEQKIRQWISDAYEKRPKWCRAVGVTAIKDLFGSDTVTKFYEMLQSESPELAYGCIGNIGEKGVARVQVLSKVKAERNLFDFEKLRTRAEWKEFIITRDTALKDRLAKFKLDKAKSGRDLEFGKIYKTLQESLEACDKYQSELGEFIMAAVQSDNFQESLSERAPVVYGIIERISRKIVNLEQAINSLRAQTDVNALRNSMRSIAYGADDYNNALENFANNLWVFIDIQKAGGPDSEFAYAMNMKSVDVSKIKKFWI